MKRPSFISIKTKLIIIFLFIIIVPVAVMTLNSYGSSQRLLERKYTDLMTDIANQSNLRIDEYLNEIEKISLMASYGMNSNISVSSDADFPVQEFLRDSGSEVKETMAYRTLMNYVQLKDRVFSIYVYNLNGGHDMFISPNSPIDYTYRAVDEPWFQGFLESEDKFGTFNTRQDRQIRAEDSLAIYHARKIFDMDNGQLIGVMVISIDINFIDHVNDRLQEGLRSRFTIVDDTNTIIYNDDQSLIGSSFHHYFNISEPDFDGGIVRSGGTDYLVVRRPFDQQPWATYLYMPIDELSSEGDILRQNFLILAGLIILFAGITSIFMSNMITRPIKRLMKNMTLVEKGQFEHLPAVRSRDEIGQLSVRFNRMSGELKQLVERIGKEEAEKAAAEMRALQSQINPHFLYNTLGSVKWIASMQKSDKIVEMTEALIAMLRYAAKHEDSTVTIGEELENIRNYMTIQNVRYYNRIQVEYEIDERLLYSRVPSLILQPIIENAIFHGLAGIEEGGVITLRIFKQGADIHIEISDNGAGMDEETISSLTEESLSKETANRYGIGLRNVQRRIGLRYGDPYGLSFSSVLGEGTKFCLILPDIKE